MAIHFFVAGLRNLARHKTLIKQFSIRDLQARTRATFLGLGWLILAPLILLAIYTTVFGQVFPSRWASSHQTNAEFALILFTGLILFQFFSEAVARSPSLVVSQPSYVTKVVFPLEILALASALAGSVQFFASLAMLCIGLAWAGLVHWTWILAPVVIAPLFLLALGVCWLLSALGVFVRDMAQVIGMVLTGLLFLSPIFYPLDALTPALQAAILWNPLTIPIEALRDVLIWGRIPSLNLLAVYWLVAAAVAALGLTVFNGLRQGFADVI